MLTTGCNCGPDGALAAVAARGTGRASARRRSPAAGVQDHPPSVDMVNITRGLPPANGWPNVGDAGSTSARSCQTANRRDWPFTTPAAMLGNASDRAVAVRGSAIPVFH